MATTGVILVVIIRGENILDQLILKNLIMNQQYVKKVLHYIKPEYFESNNDKIIFEIIKNYVKKYSSKVLPTTTVLKLQISKSSKLSEHQYSEIVEIINELEKEIEKTKNEEYNLKYLVDETENFCKYKAMERAIVNSVDVISDKKNLFKVSEMIKEALKVSFDADLGICFYNDTDIDKRILSYKQEIFKIPCKLKDLNAAFSGGVEEKTLTCFLGGTHSGKSLTKISICKDMIELGTDCVYITLEMSEENISQRIEANILDTPINDIPDSDMSRFKTNILSHGKNKGKVWIKEWPTRGASVASIRNYLDELKYKKNFEPKVIFVDYINLLNSDLYSGSQEHLRVKSITEELRGLAVETKTAIITATQTNRGGDNASDLTLKEIADSFGLTGTADAIIGIISTEELREKGVLIYKIIKNRFGGVVDFKFPVRVETEYSRITNAKQDEILKLANSVESKGKMAALYEKFSRNELTKNGKVNKNVAKGIEELTKNDSENIKMDSNTTGNDNDTIFSIGNNKKTKNQKRKIKLKFEDENNNFDEFVNEID